MTKGILAVLLTIGSVAQAEGLVVHEWGTFTAVTSPGGAPLEWRPLAVRSDLPTFVHAVGAASALRGNDPNCRGKCGTATVRMETPVIYFHTDVEQDVSVAVEFVGGAVTEAYPFAGDYRAGGVDWGRIHLVPKASPLLPKEPPPSHYYPARNVDAAAVRVCGNGRTEWEKFLFYRGIGQFPIPMKAVLADGRLRIEAPAGQTAQRAVIIHSQGGKVGLRAISLAPGATFEVPPPTQETAVARAALRPLLGTTGLFADEIEAMLDTWKDDWVEPGLRVFFLLSPGAVDERLPLKISPAPKKAVRVIVGRLEVLTPEAIARVSGERDALVGLDARRSIDPWTTTAWRTRLLEKHGRFAEALLVSAGNELPPAKQEALRTALMLVFGGQRPGTAAE